MKLIAIRATNCRPRLSSSDTGIDVQKKSSSCRPKDVDQMQGQTSSDILKNKFELSGEIKTITSNSDPELVIGQIKFGRSEDVSSCG